jgi:DNA topoisomerase IB
MRSSGFGFKKVPLALSKYESQKKQLPYLPCKGIFSPEVYTIIDGKQVKTGSNAYIPMNDGHPKVGGQKQDINRISI